MSVVLHEFDLRNRIIKFANVANPELWPKGPSAYVCIFEAINIAGQALFNSSWTGEELTAILWFEMPINPNSSLPNNRGGGAPALGAFARPVRINALADAAKIYDRHVYDWYFQRRLEKWRCNSAAMTRLLETVEWLAQRCRDGEVRSFARLQSGGPLWPVSGSEWNLENPLAAFVSEAGKKRHFPEFKHTGPYESYAFFERKDLEEVLKQLGLKPLAVNIADLSQLSPYVQLAVNVALRRGYVSKGTCDTQDVREAEVRAAWAGLIADIEPVPSMVTAIAKIMNFPDPEAIRKGQLGGKSRKTGSTAKA